jgi:hypothetical protein
MSVEEQAAADLLKSAKPNAAPEAATSTPEVAKPDPAPEAEAPAGPDTEANQPQAEASPAPDSAQKAEASEDQGTFDPHDIAI